MQSAAICLAYGLLRRFYYHDMNMTPQTCETTHDRWQARLELGFAIRGGRSSLTSRRHHGPLRVQRPFYPEGAGVCHIYVLHPPGGVVGGDELVIDVAVSAGAHALITAPAAGKFYRSAGATARQTQMLRVAAAAALEWLPQENIAFDGARAELCTRVELAEGARFIGWEIMCLGRPGAGAGFQHGVVRQRFEVWREGLPLFIARGRYEQAGAARSALWGLAGRAVSGSLLCAYEAPGLVEEVRAAISTRDGLFSATQLEGVLVCRYLGDHADEARQCFERAWDILRPAALQRASCTPRIWAT